MGFITRENAKELSRVANATRWSAARSSLKPVQEDDGKQGIAPLEDYTAKTLARVRVQLDLVNERLTEQLAKKTPDPQAIDRLASAQSRLSEQERILAGRPTPGALRPTSGKRSDRKNYSAPARAQQSQVAKHKEQGEGEANG